MDARDVVTTRIAAQARRFPALDLEPLETGGLDARDAALAVAIEQAVLRRWLTLEAVLQSQLTRPWDDVEPKLQAALLVGAAQLLLLERIPDHAAINEAVQWAKDSVRSKAGGVVNAVLRKVAGLRVELVEKTIAEPPSERGLPAAFARDELPLSDGRVWKLNEPVFAEHPVRRLAQQSSHPEMLITHWLTTFGRERTAELALHDLVHPPIIVRGVQEMPSGSSPAEFALHPHDEQGFFVFEGNREGLLHLLASTPDAIVQDSTSAAPALATATMQPPPRLIIDSCAGKGTKTRQLAHLHPQARIIAADVDPGRSETLRATFAGNPQVEVIDHDQLRAFAGQADLVVLDVPCSNTGVLARRVEAKYRFNSQSLEKVSSLQKQIIADSLALLTPAGRLLYSTCSIEPLENEQQVQWIAKWHPFAVAQSHLRFPAGLPGEPASRYRDGGFFALLQRRSKG